MSSGKPKPAATDDELSKLFEGIDDSITPAVEVTRPATSSSKVPEQRSVKSEDDILAELNHLTTERPASRPTTPKPPSLTTPRTARSPKRGTTASVPSEPPVESSAADKETSKAQKAAKVSVEDSESHWTVLGSTKSQSDEEGKSKWANEATAGDQERHPEPITSGAGWWGGLFATATAAVKTAEAAVKEIQQNEEAKRWAEQVKGNVGALKGLGGELRSRALPTFTNILHTLAPPISAHERLQIHITHDLVGYPSLDALIYQTFSRVMAQVEGGDLMVIQRGHESSPRRGSEAGFSMSGSGWGDGPWWRQSTDRRNLGVVKGLVEGTKLVRASAESFAGDFHTSRGGVEEAAKRATENLSESNPVRSSDVFLAIQAIGQTIEPNLFTGAQQTTSSEGVVEPEVKPEEVVCFAIYLYDPVHGISFSTVTQSFPLQWAEWLDASPANLQSPTAPISPSREKPSGFFGRRSEESAPPELSSYPEGIAEILRAGGADPREWAAEWIEEILSLGTGIVAQRYVARRMGVGEGGIGRGKARQEALESGGGEAARAI